MSEKLPQMRVLVTDHCGGRCIYCRPSGEGNLPTLNKSMDYSTAVNVAKLYRDLGGRDIKISGGDPIFWKHLCDYVRVLKKDLGFEHVEVVTKSPKMVDAIEDLSSCSLDVLNFSLDSLHSERYRTIVGKDDFQEYLETIFKCATKIHCKINMVVLHDTDISEIDAMMKFCVENNVSELKLLDYIDDLNPSSSRKPKKQTEQFNQIYKKLNDSGEKRTVFQGGFGHPMSQFTINENFRVTCKDSTLGSWYSDCCLKCPNYPCHDALMALRVTPHNSFQLCLLNKNLHWKFNDHTMKEQMCSVLSIYRRSFFVEGNNENDCIDTP